MLLLVRSVTGVSGHPYVQKGMEAPDHSTRSILILEKELRLAIVRFHPVPGMAQVRRP